MVDAEGAAMPARRQIPRTFVLFGAIWLLAYLVRLVPLLHGGGLGGYGRYDDGVYYAAADSLTFGRLPYRDFVMLHPPGLMLVLAPFAAIGRATHDMLGMELSRLFFIGIGSLNAGLVAVIASRWRLRAGVAAGVLYACMMPAVYSEQAAILEPLGGTALLLAILLLLKAGRPPTPRAEIVAGVALGLGSTFKIWYLATWGFVVVWQLVVRRGWSALRILVSGIIAALVVVVPFFALAPSKMYDMVLRDQLGRAPGNATMLERVSSILSLRVFSTRSGVLVPLVIVFGLVLLALALVCLTDPAARVIVALLVVTWLVLILAPSYFAHYSALTAAPIALTVGIGLGLATTRVGVPRPVGWWVLTVCAVLVAVLGGEVISINAGLRFPHRVIAAAPTGCVMSDDPGALVAMNRLSSDLRQNCQVPVDVTGITYDTLYFAGPRGKNLGYQHWMYNYLTSGQAFVLARRKGDALSAHTHAELKAHRLIAHSHLVTMRAGDAATP